MNNTKNQPTNTDARRHRAYAEGQALVSPDKNGGARLFYHAVLGLALGLLLLTTAGSLAYGGPVEVAGPLIFNLSAGQTATHSWYLENLGNSSAQYSIILPTSPNFTITASTLSGSIQPNATLTINVSVTLIKGSYSGIVSALFPANSTGQSATINTELSKALYINTPQGTPPYSTTEPTTTASTTTAPTTSTVGPSAVSHSTSSTTPTSTAPITTSTVGPSAIPPRTPPAAASGSLLYGVIAVLAIIIIALGIVAYRARKRR